MINIPTSGTYTFKNNKSDDECAVFIDGQMVVAGTPWTAGNPWGLSITGTDALTAGMHNIVVAYYQGFGGYNLDAQIAGPGITGTADIGSAGTPRVTPDLVVGSLTGSGNVSLATGNLTTGFDNTSTTFAGQISGIGGVNKWGSGTLALAGSSTYTGPTTLVAGVLQLAGSEMRAPAARWASAEPSFFPAARSSIRPPTPTTIPAASAPAAGQFYNVDTNGQGVTWASPLVSSGGNLTKLGSGTLTLGGANTFTGNTLISSGTLALSNGLALQNEHAEH